MIRFALTFLLFSLITACGGSSTPEAGGDQSGNTGNNNTATGDTQTADSGAGGNTPGSVDRELFDVINAYRQSQALDPVDFSPSLTAVAEAHVADLEVNPPSGSCNLHSWSNQPEWSGCCYTPDHAQAACMWNKPDEISGGVYSGYGYEISAYTSGTMTAELARDLWIGSSGHHNVMINASPWTTEWQAMGAAMSEHYAVVWFGHAVDPAAAP